MSLLPEQRAFTTLHTVTLATQMLGRTGIASERLLDGSGIRPDELDNPARLICHAQELQVLANALAMVGVAAPQRLERAATAEAAA